MKEKSKSSTGIRVVSAIIALIVLIGLYVFFKGNGLLIVILAGTLMAQFEYSQLVIDRPSPSLSRALLVTGCFLIAISSLIATKPLGLPVGFVLILFFSFFLIRYRNETDLSAIRDAIGISALGLLYVGVLPAFIIGLFKQPYGDLWFFTMLGVVFFGDTFAYFTGRALGKKKILATISPNKTWAGALGGLVGSALASLLAKLLFFQELPVLPLVVLALIAGACAQIGDFFESLLKRVANKKDSGSIMPGHGGILDRIDGVLFTAPHFYLASVYFSALFGTTVP